MFFNLPQSLSSEEAFHRRFEEEGRAVPEIVIMKNRRNLAVQAEFPSVKEAVEVLKKWNGTEVDGQMIRVR
jgi:hypothetical protein